ncbi:peptidyl-tRNA hydrolase isoform X2 [Pelodiscus sinensis]|uniref:peptidyl-tRNA hydrolase isoform X2 n=1 Tax=Pelodiscus sinensis TaxID=13735 RepID=UPI000D7227BE|nr:probable peptidyl-tRNA hydrolase isoform X2 [Pelodiscus sinensis]|eukprot:XP_025038386.1 probable peptidyl-tRNA hydrolase isoform X2 [Pelodiscus sinensis]
MAPPINPRSVTPFCSRTRRHGHVVAGLGNYGLQGTRHNVGMAVLNQLAQKLNIANQWKADRRCRADVTITNVEEAKLVLMKPRQLMNINGLSVASAAEIYKFRVEDIYLVHDDLDKPLGKMAIKLGGSARYKRKAPVENDSGRFVGHNGVRSCISSLHSDCMVRLRVGIGRPVDEAMVDRYVLDRFTGAEQEVVQHVLEKAADLLLEHILHRNSSKATPAVRMRQDCPPPGSKGDSAGKGSPAEGLAPHGRGPAPGPAAWISMRNTPSSGETPPLSPAGGW